VDRGEGDRPGICCVFAHGAPETPVLVLGGKDFAHLFVSVIGGEIPCPLETIRAVMGAEPSEIERYFIAVIGEFQSCLTNQYRPHLSLAKFCHKD
jgi:hypothetical protein